MTILDTGIVIDRIREKKPIQEDITAVTFVEYPGSFSMSASTVE